MTRAVLWDFDGTLAYRDGMWRGALVETLDAVLPGHGVLSEALRPGLRDGFPWHRPDVGHAHATADAWWSSLEPVLVGACTSAGACAVPEGFLAAFRSRYLDPGRWTVFEDTRPALARLAGYRHVVVSNHVPELPSLVSALDLPVDAVVTSAVVGWEKPHPRMWEAALAAAGSPDEVWMVGDNPEADVRGAQAAGIPAVLVRSGVGLLDAAALILG